MKETTQVNFDGGFNVISCGYMVAGILGETVDHAHAQTHWPACKNMATVKDGIPPPNPNPPTVKSVSPEPAAPDTEENPETANVFQSFATWWNELFK